MLGEPGGTDPPCDAAQRGLRGGRRSSDSSSRLVTTSTTSAAKTEPNNAAPRRNNGGAQDQAGETASAADKARGAGLVGYGWVRVRIPPCGPLPPSASTVSRCRCTSTACARRTWVCWWTCASVAEYGDGEYASANAARLQAALDEAQIAYRHRKELAPTTDLRQLQYREDDRRDRQAPRTRLAREYRERYVAEILDRADLDAVVAELPTDRAAALMSWKANRRPVTAR